MNTQATTMEKEASVKNGVFRMIIAVISIFINVLLFIWGFFWLNKTLWWVSAIMSLISFFVVLGIYSMNRTPSIKLPWIMLILAFPVAGIVFYLIVGMNRSTKTMRNRYKKIDEVLLPLLPDNADVQKKLAEKNRHVAGITHYLKKYSGYPVYNNTDIIYYDDAAKGLEAQKEDFERIFEVSNEVTDYYASGRGAFLRFSQLILRLAAPLM